jgi:hypothetical protein
MATMSLKEFSAASRNFWDKYLAIVADRIARFVMKIPSGYTAYYPTSIIFTEMHHHFAMELAGYAKELSPLRAIYHKIDSTNSFPGTFPVQCIQQIFTYGRPKIDGNPSKIKQIIWQGTFDAPH